MLRLEHIRKIYPTGEVLKDINWEVKNEERVGLVGVNGAGKSTQMRIIMGEIEPTDGEIIRPADLKLAHLTQEFDVILTRTVREELWTVFTEANHVQETIHEVHHQIHIVVRDNLSSRPGMANAITMTTLIMKTTTITTRATT